MGEDIRGTYPASRLGEYTVIQEIAEGTFGKVKSNYASCPAGSFVGLTCTPDSGCPYRNGSQSCHEVHLEAGYRCYKDENSSATRGGIHASFEASAHHQAVWIIHVL